MENHEQEGVIKFRLEFTHTAPIHSEWIKPLEAWRQRMIAHGLIGGHDPQRYDGLGFGNISHRQQSDSGSFIVSGTQTGHLPHMGADKYALVKACDPAKNTLQAEGAIAPSSEAMTHAVIYNKLPNVQAVIHVHSPHIWNKAEQLGIAITHPDVPYGTPQMAAEMQRLIDAGANGNNTISMGGHEDGVITWGETLDQSGEELLGFLSQIN